MRFAGFVVLIFLTVSPVGASEPVSTVAALVAAVRDGAEGTTVEIAGGTYELEAPLEPKSGMTLKGAGIEKTVLTQAAAWQPSTKSLPDPEMTTKGLDSRAYLIRLQDKAAGVTISDLTLRASQLHGAIYSWDSRDLKLERLRIQDTLWCGVRTFLMKGAKIHHCEFIDAGGRWEKGQPGLKGGITGGGIFCIWSADCEFAHNRFDRTQQEKADEFYGIKGRQGKRCRIHHNTINVNFSIEFPFEGDEDIEIDHNVCRGTISIPKHAGGPVPKSGRTFHIHHNWFSNSYAIEFVRNGVEIDHNLFDFDVKNDGGNLISGFGKAAAAGPASFHNNLISNPGRGVIWINEIFNNLDIHHNHIIARPTVTPRKEGLFGFNPGSDFKTLRIRNNRIECLGESRPLLRNKQSYGADVQNNELTNVLDAERFEKLAGDGVIGLEKPLEFECGVEGEYSVRGWEAKTKAGGSAPTK